MEVYMSKVTILNTVDQSPNLDPRVVIVLIKPVHTSNAAILFPDNTDFVQNFIKVGEFNFDLAR
jgi:hypothetical protein